MEKLSNSTYTAAVPSISSTAVHVPSPTSLSPKAKFALAIALPTVAILVIVMAAVHIILRRQHQRQHSVAKVARAVQDVEDLEGNASLKTPIGLHRIASRELLRTKSAPPLRPQEAKLAREADGGDHSSMTGETGACREVGSGELRKLQTYDAVGKRTIYWG